ncbi:MAG: SCO family protein [Sorangiineae bacterium]|nr:SCO family protein [Polyangiaceae bacterium]MEB2322774.1 SCO family protein [Sorangiineae bacterium]
MTRPARRRSLAILAVVGVWAVLLVAVAAARREARVRAAAPPAAGPLPVLWELPAFSFRDQHGETVSRESLRGHVVVANFIFTRCTTVCPLTTAKMNVLRRSVRREDARFVSFSVDPEYDTPARLLDYARRWKDDTRWHLLSTDAAGLDAVASAMKVTVEKSRDPRNPIIHTTLFFLADREGKVRGVYDSDDDRLLERLASDAEELERDATSASAADPRPEPSDGASAERLFQSAGCAGCHDDRRVAPPLGGLPGSPVTLASGETIIVDRGYLRRSILEPRSERASGFVVTMPSYRGKLTNAEVELLVDYLERLPASPHAPPPGGPGRASRAEKTVDPVCGMTVLASEDAPHALHDGKRYTFCSDACRERFVKEPARYLKR